MLHSLRIHHSESGFEVEPLRIVSTLLIILLGQMAYGQTAGYDPLKTEGQVSFSDTEFTYGEDNRVVPLRIANLPARNQNAGSGSALRISRIRHSCCPLSEA